MEQAKEYYAFISYKREDEKWAKWLQDKLEHYKFPTNLNGRTDLPKNIRPTFRDVTDLNPGLLAEEINNGLRNSEWLIVVCSPRSAKSPWVCKEAQTFIDLGRADHIIPFVIEGNPFSNDTANECYPEALLNLTGSKELLAANINEMGREAAAIKVVARMFNLRFDALWQRYEREQRRKKWMLIGGSILFALLGLGIGLYFVKQNRTIENQNVQLEKANIEISRERDRANTEKDKAERISALLSVANDSISRTNEALVKERNTVDSLNNDLRKSVSRFVAKEAINLVRDGDSYLARRLLLEVLPSPMSGYDWPLTKESEQALAFAWSNSMAVLHGHHGAISRIATSPSGDIIATGAWDNTIMLWDTHSGRLLNTIKGHEDTINYLGFSSENTLISKSLDKTIRVWDVPRGEEKQILRFNEHAFLLIEMSADLQSAIICSSIDDSCTVSLYNINGVCEKMGEICLPNRILSLAYSPNNKSVGMGAGDGSLFVWDLKTGEEVHRLIGHSKEVFTISFNDNGSLLATGGDDGSICIWNKDLDGSSFSIRNRINTGNPISKVGFTAYNSLLSASYNDKSIIFWDLEGEKLSVINASIPITSPPFILSPRGTLFAYPTEDNVIHLVDSNTGVILDNIEGHHGYISCLSFSQDGEFLLSGSWDKMVRLRRITCVPKAKISHGSSVNTVSFDRSGSRILSSSLDGTFSIWDSRTGSRIKTILGHNDAVSAAFFLPGSEAVITASWDHSVRTWNILSGQEVFRIPGILASVLSLSVSPDGRIIAIGGDDNTIKIWNTETGELNHTIFTDSWPTAMSIDNTGELLAYAILGKGLFVWDILSRKEVSRIEQDATSISYSPSGRWLAVGSSNGDITVWDAQLKRRYYSLVGHNNTVHALAFSPDEQFLVSGSFDCTVRLWDIKTQNQLQMKKAKGAVMTVSFREDGREIAYGDETGIIEVFSPLTMRTNDLLNITIRTYRNNPLSDLERKSFYL